MTLALLQLLNGLQYGLLLFLAASGLTLVFGILGVINLAHGAFYMLGAYLAFSLVKASGDVFLALFMGLPLAFIFGALVEWLFIRPLYGRDHLQQVLLTFALILVCNEAQQSIWGVHPLSVPVPAYLDWSVQLTSTLAYPAYRLALIVLCLALAGGLALVINKTRIGMLIRAARTSREMVEATGHDSRLLFRAVFASGAALAVAAGMLAAPIEGAYPGIGERMLILSFVVVVIGGIGSVRGAFVGALALGVVDAFGKVVAPDLAGVLVYALMALALVMRPAAPDQRA